MRKNDIFNDLKAIIVRLKPYEAEVAGNYLGAFDRRKDGRPTKLLRVFEKLRSTPNIGYDALKGMFSPEVNKYHFNKFLARLRDKLFDSLTLDLNIHRKDSYSEWFRARQECTKNWILVMNLIGRGNEIVAQKLLNSSIRKCEQFELYDLLVSFLRIQLNIEGLRLGSETFNRIVKKVSLAEEKRDAIYCANEWNTRYYMVADRKASQNEQVGILMEALSELQSLFSETNTSIVGQLAYYFEMEYHQALGDYEAVRRAGYKLVELISTRPALKSEIKLSGAYANLAFNDILLHDFDSALKNIDKSFVGSGTGSYNHVVITTLKAQAQYFNQDFASAYDTVDCMLHTDMIKVAPYEQCKMEYMKGCVLFNRGEFFKAYHVFSSDNILMDTDPEGWNIGVRFMCILCMIELQLDDLADLSIDSLRKYMNRTSDERYFQPRDKAILKILRSLERNSFDFAKTYFKNQELFFKLQSDDPDYCWKVKSHEHIVFHKWFEAKLAEKTYQFSIPELNPLETADLNERK